MDDKIPTFAINLVNRTDRKASLVSEFAGKEEFLLTVVPAIAHEVGSFGLWQTIRLIIHHARNKEIDYVLVCEDDHVFSPCYSKDRLLTAITEASDRQADVLLGGVSWLAACVPVEEHLFWVEKFSGLQFAVIFKRFYAKILDASFKKGDAADYKISSLSSQIYFIYPFISTQRNFGYSDVTPDNNEENRVENLFLDAANRVDSTKRVISFYKSRICQLGGGMKPYNKFRDMFIMTYIIPPERDRRQQSSIDEQFNKKTEFDIQIVELCEHENAVKAYWLSIQEIVRLAMMNDDDAIIICEADHQFTEAYSKEILMRHIFDANWLGTGVLCGGIDDMETAVPAARDKFWINAFKSASFLVLYRIIFDKILKQPFTNQPTRGELYREITSNKIVIFPFISARREVEHSKSRTVALSKENVSTRLAKIYKVAESCGVIDSVCSNM